MTLSPKRARFVQEYLKDLNAKQAALRAGYAGGRSGRSAEAMGSYLLRNPEVQAAIAAAQRRVAERAEVSATRVLQEYAAIAFADIGEVLDFSGPAPRLRDANTIPAPARQAIASMKTRRYLEGHGDDARTVEVTEFKFWDKRAALADLMRHLGLFLPDVSLPLNHAALTDDQLQRIANGEHPLRVLADSRGR